LETSVFALEIETVHVHLEKEGGSALEKDLFALKKGARRRST